MLTIKPEIRKHEKRSDGTFNVKIRFTQNRTVIRKSTHFYATPNDLTSSLALREGSELKLQVDSLLLHLQKRCIELGLEEKNFSLNEIITILYDEYGVKEGIDFIQFSQEWISTTEIKGAKNYKSAINAFKLFLKKDSLPIQELDRKMLNSFCAYLGCQYQERAKVLKKEGKRVPSERAASLYLGSLRHLFKEAQLYYNDYDRNIIRIGNDPFRNFFVPQQKKSRKRALSVELIRKVMRLPYKCTNDGETKRRCIYNLAKDCFILSFCLMGMNSVDLFYAKCFTDGYIVYNRTKTKDRRADDALIKVFVPVIINSLMQRYKDKSGDRLFDFYQYYSTEKNFNRAINKGLKEIGEELGIEDLEFYAARHSWATIALNKCHIDKYTVHAALNHVDPSMRVTDIYIERDFVNENAANKKVLEYVFG